MTEGLDISFHNGYNSSENANDHLAASANAQGKIVLINGEWNGER
jgi:hypothetical protein